MTDERFFTPRAQATSSRSFSSEASFSTPRTSREMASQQLSNRSLGTVHSISSSESSDAQFATPRHYNYNNVNNNSGFVGSVAGAGGVTIMPIAEGMHHHHNNDNFYFEYDGDSEESSSKKRYYRKSSSSHHGNTNTIIPQQYENDTYIRQHHHLSPINHHHHFQKNKSTLFEENKSNNTPQHHQYSSTSGDVDVEDVFSLARHDRRRAVEMLLLRGVPPDVRDVNGNTILSIACQNGNKRMCKLALRYNANINSRNNRGNTALHFCYK